ncbi:molybdopterin-binding protein [uncultured Veillonella sp.]|uniref:molybdopterin-binding protein n=1 Tax=uncultured Veillonella sp. TaxID=159268 RepID=UPI0025DB71A6|nr:molybdopterin-binding protein [uncultured Veillonella sp.]MDY3974319.1 molybdopterin-binding protein [Veillonella caviae]
MKKVHVKEAIGEVLCHDIARIVIGKVKDTPFRRGHRLEEKDIPFLLELGKEHIFVMDESDTDKIHEEDVAAHLYSLCANESILPTPVREGKIEAIAQWDGLLVIDLPELLRINSIGDLTIVTKWHGQAVKQGEVVAGMRCIPLMLDGVQWDEAKSKWNGEPILKVLPYTRSRVGVVTTGSEVATGRIADAFTPIIKERIAEYGMTVVAHEIVTDDTDAIVAAIERVKASDVDVIFCTGGMSVDPDDLTPGAIRQVSSEFITYGLPVLPGSMVCMAYLADGTPIMGLPGGVLFSKPTAFDVFLPRLAADYKITKEQCIALGHGGLQ